MDVSLADLSALKTVARISCFEAFVKAPMIKSQPLLCRRRFLGFFFKQHSSVLPIASCS